MANDDVITIEVDAEKLLKALDSAPRELKRQLQQAGKSAAKIVLDTRGVQEYPAETSANRPPTPYYIRNRGTQYKSYNKGESENIGKQWSVRSSGYGVTIGNRASYAPYVHGTKGVTGNKGQAWNMGLKGWNQIWLVAKRKTAEIARKYDQFISEALRRAGLK